MSDVFPDRDMPQDEKIAWVVQTQGGCAEPVPADESRQHPPYTYTIGFESSYGHPEVLIVGLQPVAARGLMSMMAEHLVAGGELPVGVFAGLLDNGLRSALLPLDLSVHSAAFPGAATFHGERPWRVEQFVWPDKQGLLPWEDGYEERLRLAQPVLGSLDALDDD